MKKVTNLNEYMDKANLELCLTMIEGAYQDFQTGAYDLAEAQIRDILDTFERTTTPAAQEVFVNNVIPFQKV